MNEDRNSHLNGNIIPGIYTKFINTTVNDSIFIELFVMSIRHDLSNKCSKLTIVIQMQYFVIYHTNHTSSYLTFFEMP